MYVAYSELRADKYNAEPTKMPRTVRVELSFLLRAELSSLQLADSCAARTTIRLTCKQETFLWSRGTFQYLLVIPRILVT